MENKDFYTSEEVEEIVSLHDALNARQDFMYGEFERNPTYIHDKRLAKSIAKEILEELPIYKKMPENIKKRLNIEVKVNCIKKICEKRLSE